VYPHEECTVAVVATTGGAGCGSSGTTDRGPGGRWYEQAPTGVPRSLHVPFPDAGKGYGSVQTLLWRRAWAPCMVNKNVTGKMTLLYFIFNTNSILIYVPH